MKWNEFSRSGLGKFQYSPAEEETTVECPKCGSFVYMRNDVVLTTDPPQFSYFCKNCGWGGSSFAKWSPPNIPTSIINAVLGDDE